MPKRSWEQANVATAEDVASSQSAPHLAGAPVSASPTGSTSRSWPGNGPSPPGPGHAGGPRRESANAASSLSRVEISRKVKACAACRKQKIRCIMDESGPPCRRCSERNLSCVLNKSLQMLIEEKTQWQDDIIHDLELVHSAVQGLREHISLPPLPALRSTSQRQGPVEHLDITSDRQEDVGPSCDNSPKLLPQGEDGMPHVPMQSVYYLTKLRALRSNDAGDEENSLQGDGQPVKDFISDGHLSLVDAQRLFNLYMDRLDHFMYRIGGRWKTLESSRSHSPILTACICTVAALHDAESNHLYPICNREFRRLMSSAIFDRRIDRDHLRALCIGSYWLSDISWMLSGYALRRAAEVNLSANYHRLLTEGSDDAADCLRLWYSLYICDKHLSILYGRPSLVREDFSVQGWEGFLKLPSTTDDDRRTISQVALLVILNSVNELFGPDNGQQIPLVYSTQIASFSRQLDHWVGYWSTTLQNPHEAIGEFPTKGVLIHYHFGKLYLFSHVFRGLGEASIPASFQDAAAGAVQAATSIVELLLTDPDLRDGLRGMPSYLHSMTAFACVFLLKIATKRNDGLIETALVSDLANRLVKQFRAVPVSKWHLVHLMADGLEKVADGLLNNVGHPGSSGHGLARLPTTDFDGMHDSYRAELPKMGGMEAVDPQLLGADIGFGIAPFPNFDSADLNFNYESLRFV